MGFDLQMMSMLGGMGGGGGMGSALMHFDPAMSGLMSMMHTAQSAKSLTPQGNPGENDAIADALGNMVKAVTSGLQKK